MFPILLLLLLISHVQCSVICYQCYANSTEAGKFCSIDKLCKGSSCYFNFNSDNSWSAGCSDALSTNANITCTAGSTSSSCSCNSDFCNSFAKSETALKGSVKTGRGSWFGNRNHDVKDVDITLTLPDRGLVHCEECGSVTVNGETVVIPCDRNHTCRGNYCVSVRGQAPYSYCGGVWDVEKAPACYFNDSQPEVCICSMNMCNGLLEPEPLMTTTASLGDPTLATLATLAPAPPVQNDPATQGVQLIVTTEKPTTKRRCKNAKLSPNDQAVFMGEKLKNVIMGGFGSDDGAVQNFEDDINDHICNYSDDEEEAAKKK